MVFLITLGLPELDIKMREKSPGQDLYNSCAFLNNWHRV